MNTNVLPSTCDELPRLMSRLGIQYGPAGIPSSRAPREWTLDAIASRLGMTDLREHIVEERMITPRQFGPRMRMP